MKDIKELIASIPDGQKIESIGRYFYQGLLNYAEELNGDEIDLDDLVVQEFGQLIQSKKFISLLRLWSQEDLKEMMRGSFNEDISVSKLRRYLEEYYDIFNEKEEVTRNVVSHSSVCENELHDFQERVRRGVMQKLFAGETRFIIHMPTGSGKTRTAAEILLDFVRVSPGQNLLQKEMKILWVAQSNELCFQAYETVKWLFQKKYTRNICLAHFYGDNDLPDNLLDSEAIIFCSIQKLLGHYTEDLWKKIKSKNYLIVIDEAHRSVAVKWLNALEYFASDEGVYLLGLTATPGGGSNDNEDRTYNLSSYFRSNKITLTDKNYVEISNPIGFLTEGQYLARINNVVIETAIELGVVRYDSDDEEFKFGSSGLKELSVSALRNRTIINLIEQHAANGEKILVFTCGLEHSEILVNILSKIGILAKAVDQSTKNREGIINDFKCGNLNVLLNFGVLTTGFDAPKTNVCIIARPVSSIVMYSQMVGRILRGPKNNGNPVNTLYTIKDNTGHGGYDEMFNAFNDHYKTKM